MQEIQEILNKLKDNNWWVRKNTIENLLAYPEDSYLSILEEWLRNGDDALLRNAAMEAFRTLGEKAVRSLISLLKDKDPDVRIFAANVLGDIGDAEAFSALIPALDDPDVNVKIASAEALGKIGSERAITALAKLIGNTTWVTMAAIEAIGEIGGDNALSVLHKCLEKEEYHGMTFAAIEKAGTHHFIRHLTPFVDKETGLRELALKAIVAIADREGTKPMPSYFTSLIPLLIDLQHSAQPEFKKAAFIALCWSEDMRGFQYFIDALNDEYLQEYAISGLISLGKRAVPGIIDALKKEGANRVILAKVLSMLGENTALLRFAGDDDAEVRTEVALAIGSLKTPKAIETLMILEQDTIDEVRAAAQLSLRNKKDTGKLA
ncbi:MAG: HEAT repeat domain-containing protein [Thermodesulfovibrionales bacterium]|nr:HEAT repeat domain-containing protein [Thermodesulfovibrionales bacterium]